MMEFFRLLKWELFRMYARPRTYIGFAVFLLVEGLVLFLLSRPSIQRGLQNWIENVAGGFDHFFSGLTLAFILVGGTVFLLGAPFLSLVSGDIVAKESEDGNLRLLLARPVSRLRLLMVKYVACQIYALSLFLFISSSALLVGIIERGWGGGYVVMTPEMPHASIFEWGEGLGRFYLMPLFLVVSYLPLTSFAFMLSCMRIKPAAATITTLAVVMADFVLANFPLFPLFKEYRDWFVTPRMQMWVYSQYQDIPWPKVVENWAWLVGIGLTGFVLGWMSFERRDIKS
ncbi:MAG: ABC transporter permease [Verrucomicrobiota bacterium]